MSLARPASAGKPRDGGPAVAAARPPYRGGARRRVCLRLSERAERVARGRGGAVVLRAARRSGAGPGGRRRLPARRLSRTARRPARRLPSGSSEGCGRRPASGKAIYGECGGYMVLGETLIASDGRVHRMAGLLPLATSFAERRLHLGYREATVARRRPAREGGRKVPRPRISLCDDRVGRRGRAALRGRRFLRRRSRPGRAASRFRDRLVHPPDRPRRGLTRCRIGPAMHNSRLKIF